MRETRADTARAVLLALALHALPLLVLLLASLWRTPQESSAGEPVVADMIDPNALSAPMRAALRAEPEPLPEPPQPPPEPVDEPVDEPLPDALPETTPEAQPDPQEQLPDPDEVDQAEVDPDALSEDAAAREQEARQRQAQVDLTERERQREAQARKAAQELADVRRQREAAARAVALSEERLRQLADRRAREATEASAATAAPPPGNRGASPNSEAYRRALIDAIRSNWTRPDNVSPQQRCRIVIRQIPPGEVFDAQVDPSCPYDEQGRRSIEAAVRKAEPLPYAGFEDVFQRTLILNFQAQDP